MGTTRGVKLTLLEWISYLIDFVFPFLGFSYICWRVEPNHLLRIASTIRICICIYWTKVQDPQKRYIVVWGLSTFLSACIWIDFFSVLFQPLNFLICIFAVVSCYSLQSLIFSLGFFCLFPLTNWFYFNMDMQCNLAYGRMGSMCVCCHLIGHVCVELLGKKGIS